MEQIAALFREGELFADAGPSFAPLGQRVEGHVGVIDIGSNSVRLVVFEGGGRAPTPLYNEKALCGLGEGLAETGRLNPEGRERARAAIGRYVRLAGGMGVRALAGVATAAVRDAGDGAEFARLIERETQLRLRIVTGEEEARIAGLGVLFGLPQAAGVVADLGGGSLELCRVEGGRAGIGVSLPIGPLRLPRGRLAEVAAIARADLGAVASRFLIPGGTLYVVGGAWRALARAHMVRTGYPVPILHEYETDAAAIAATAEWAAGAAPQQIEAIEGVSAARVGAMPASAAILSELIRALGPEMVTVSGFGLREGVCFAQMPQVQRRLDPLIEACRDQERRRARFPGFGAELGDWLTGFLDPVEPEEARLLVAAAHLSDVNWRTHPDYRSVACVETVTRVHLTGGGHRGRGFIATTLLMRHKHGRKTAEREPLSEILDADARARAEIAGRAMRLGTTISGAAPGALPDCPLVVEAGRLVLRVPPASARLVADEVERRLAAVAEAIGRPWKLEVG